MRGFLATVFGAGALACVATGGCSVKTEASDVICVPDQSDLCTDCDKPDPSDTRMYRGRHTCAHDGKSFGRCDQCAPVDEHPATTSEKPTWPAGSSDGGSSPHGSESPPPDKQPPPEGGPPDEREAGTSGGDCTGPLAQGDLAIVEVMIASQASSPDYGEWFEVENTRSCRLNVKGLHVESPRGSEDGVDALDVADDLWLMPGETFVVASSLEPGQNGHLPGTVLPWSPWQGAVTHDALLDAGEDSIVISDGVTQTEIDRAAWDAAGWGLHVGSSVSFSTGCTWAERGTWSNWGWSTNPWLGAANGFYGTPNAANDDLVCPHAGGP